MRWLRHFMASYALALMALLFMTTAAWSAQVRVATHNIKFLSTEVVNQGDRLSKLRRTPVTALSFASPCRMMAPWCSLTSRQPGPTPRQGQGDGPRVPRAGHAHV